MKKVSLKRMLYLMSIMLLTGMVMVSCKKDDEDDPDPDPDPVLVEDGIYVKGAGTALAEFDLKGMMKATRNEVNQEDRAALLELFVAVKAGTEGFNIVKVAGTTHTTYGPGADWAIVGEADRINDEPKLDFWRGSIAETDAKFTVAEDGLYHIVFDTELNKGALIPVKYWGLIGAATPGGWGGDTEMPAGGFDMNTMTFELADVTMTQADFKFRYSGGWKVVIDDEVDLGEGVLGIRVNTNYGGAVNDLVPGGSNIANAQGGKYTAKIVWTLGEKYAATLTKTGDLDAFNYTDTELGLIGGALIVDGASWGWDNGYQLHKPVVEGETNYTWTWNNIEVDTEGGGFKIREGENWDGLSFGYPQVTMAGLAADKFETNDDGNFIPVEAGVFDIVFHIDAVTDVRTFTVNPAGAAPELFLLGDGSPAGWDNENATPLQGTDGEYSLTVDLPGGGYLKFIEVLGQWAPQYGTDDTGTSEGGPLVYRPDESAPDPAAIPAPEAAGTYVINVNTNDLTYTIAPAK